MEYKKFEEFWNVWAIDWLSRSIKVDGADKQISSLCSFVDDAAKQVWDNYNVIKRLVKEHYYSKPDALLSKYRRAASIAYAINSSAPLMYKDREDKENKIDVFFLKQRLAFWLGWASIIMEYSESDVKAVRGARLFFPVQSLSEQEKGIDSFELGMYKGLFYAQLYNAYDVIAMSNVYWLLTEKASSLSGLTPISDKDKR